MTKFAIALQILQWINAGAEALAKMRRTYEVFVEQAKRDKELTEAESAELDAKAAEIFASPASQLSGR